MDYRKQDEANAAWARQFLQRAGASTEEIKEAIDRIESGFVWADTPEGGPYWCSQVERLEEKAGA